MLVAPDIHPRLLMLSLGCIALVLSLAGCGPDSDGEPPCKAGTVLCECLDGLCPGGPGLACVDDICVYPACSLGSAECSCTGDGSCDIDATGVQLVCDTGLCVAPDCELGAPGCACAAGGECGVGLSCHGDGLCVSPTCEGSTGSLGCACNADRSCSSTLACVQGLCIDPGSCTIGTDGCPCFRDTSCGAGFACSPATDYCEAILCSPGAVGCECLAGACVGDSSICIDGRCEIEGCPTGSEGCACNPSNVCGVNYRGEQLLCSGGTCVAPSCMPGNTGCVCGEGTTCDDSGDSCISGFCMSDGCVDGSLSCPCANGSVCSGDLVCREGSICVDGAGHTGGPCLPNGTCERGNKCNNALCQPCFLGSTGCGCDDAGVCLPGLACMSDHCVPEESIVATVPTSPLCYTPCSTDLDDESAAFQACSSEGLIDNCVGDLTCTDGSCVAPGAQVPTCASDIDCPDHQACMPTSDGVNRCYSNCESGTDCGAGSSCHKKVCRFPCSSTSSSSCPGGTDCILVDTVNGFCMPSAGLDPTGQSQNQVLGDFSLSETTVALSNVNPDATLTIVNNSPTPATFTIRKLQHTMFFSDATSDTLVDFDDAMACISSVDCPLFWLAMGPVGGAGAQLVSEFDLVVPANNQSDFQITGGGSSSAVRWSGALEVVHPTMGTAQVSMTYSERPEGQWRGTAYYYSNFRDDNIDAWAASPTSRNNITLQTQVGNALVQKWGAFRRGDRPWSEMEAAIIATNTGSWRDASSLPECLIDGCFHWDGDLVDGLGDFSSNLATIPIPTGVIEMPFAMNLYQPNPLTQPGALEGRIETPLALNYVGYPAVSLSFSGVPDTCDATAFGACISYIDSFDATIHVGGRYETTPSDSNCAQRFGANYVLEQTPWLLPGFDRNTYQDSSNGLLYRWECRDSMLPFEIVSALDPASATNTNIGLSGSNPIPDGRTRRRTIELLDGALINQSSMVLLFKEEMVSFLDPTDSEGLRSYGIVMLQKEAATLSQDDQNGNLVLDVYEGSAVVDTRTDPNDVLDVTCSPEILDAVLPTQSLSVSSAASVIDELIDGIASGSAATPLDSASNEQVHYLCVETGLFDGGSQNDTQHGVALGVADNSCGAPFAFNGVCEDGGYDAAATVAGCTVDSNQPDCITRHSECALGTDATDCGPRATDDNDARVRCPIGSDVVFFTVDHNLASQADIANEPCQLDGTCEDTLLQWQAGAGPLVQMDPTFTCTSSAAYCDINREDLRDGKQFYGANELDAVFTPFRTEVETAFRYKVRFQSRDGSSNVGFAPEICVPNSNQVPYCYHPSQIEHLTERVDCLVHIWDTYYTGLVATGTAPNLAAVAKLDDFLAFTFSEEVELIGGDPNRARAFEGFERLYAELLVMMGDESFTQAFASRFDLAALNTAAFEGELFEENGINLSGIPGFEMRSLYQAVQYYQEALDRFYALSPLVWAAVTQSVPGRTSFVTPETVTTYMDRLLRASTQKSRAWGAIAQRYQNLNRPDLARAVIERAFTATYLESVAFSRIMQRIRDSFLLSEQPQIDQVLESSQLRYRMALLDMRNVYISLTDQTTIFGLDPDFVPFPTISGDVASGEDNAFEKLKRTALERMQLAKVREESALASSRAFETDAAEFQSELTRIRNTYENQLAGICGTFGGDDGNVYPAIKKYAALSADTARLGDPCGLVGNGEIFEAMVGVDLARTDLEIQLSRWSANLEQIEVERERVRAQCGYVQGLADFVLCRERGLKCENVPEDAPTFESCSGDSDPAACEDDSVFSLENEIRSARFGQSTAREALESARTIAEVTKCTTIVGASVGTDCHGTIISTAMITFASLTNLGVQIGLQSDIDRNERKVNQIRDRVAHYQTSSQCTQFTIDSEATLKSHLIENAQIELETVRAQYQIQLAMSQMQRLVNEARRIESEQAEVESMAINVAASRNDPNVRLYRNDAIINANISFQDALEHAYRATRVYEYYTSQTYAARDQLYLIRMVSVGTYNLENYLTDLDNAFIDFEQQFGDPDLRVEIISLRDDLLRIPLLNDLGEPLSQYERSVLLHERLLDPSLLDRNGYLTIPFSTATDQLSPLTRNHKIAYIEADVIASDYGDEVARVYVRQKGTGTVDAVDSSKLFFRFATRTAVIDVFFNGKRFFDPTMYRTTRFQDRPFANTAWELVINQRDEAVNNDLDLQSVSDIRLYVHYSDFTVF